MPDPRPSTNPQVAKPLRVLIGIAVTLLAAGFLAFLMGAAAASSTHDIAWKISNIGLIVLCTVAALGAGVGAYGFLSGWWKR